MIADPAIGSRPGSAGGLAGRRRQFGRPPGRVARVGRTGPARRGTGSGGTRAVKTSCIPIPSPRFFALAESPVDDQSVKPLVD